jgi:hypothetical protein
MNLRSTALGGRRYRPGQVEASAIRQPWLREVVKTWATTVSLDSGRFKRVFAACVVASDALHARPGGGQDYTKLRFADMQAVFTAMSRIRRTADDELASRSHRQQSFGSFIEIVDFGRKTDMLIGMPGSFDRDKTLVLPPEETSEDAAGRAVPEPVIAQLDAHLALMGVGFSYGDMEPADIELMMQTAYLVLRDTGRRPVEIASLQLKCLETRADENTLGNHDLVDRVNELTEENLRLSTAERQATAQNADLQQRVAELEDDLAAARTSLRRMIRNENRD